MTANTPSSLSATTNAGLDYTDHNICILADRFQSEMHQMLNRYLDRVSKPSTPGRWHSYRGHGDGKHRVGKGEYYMTLNPERVDRF